MGKCQEDSYYDCISSQIDGTTEFNECSKKCIPNAFSKMGRNYSTTFCQNDTSNQQCIAKQILKEDVVGGSIGVKVRNMKMDFNTGWRHLACVGQCTLMII